MPYIELKTNAEIADSVKEEIKAELGSAITAIPGKSEAWLMVQIEDKASMWFKGDGSPTAMFDISIFGSASDSAYDDLTKRICKIAEEKLDIPACRTYVKYSEINHWGYDNFNF